MHAPDAATALAAAAAMAQGGVDVVADTTGRAGFSDAPGLMNPRGRIILLAGTGRRIDLDQWAFYTRELHLVGFIMSGMTISELAEAAEWINTQHGVRPLTVGVAPVMRFADAARAHSIVESGQLPRLSDHTTGRLTLMPSHSWREGRARSSRDEP